MFCISALLHWFCENLFCLWRVVKILIWWNEVPFSTFLCLQGDHRCSCAQHWCFFFILSQELSSEKKNYWELRQKMSNIGPRGSCFKDRLHGNCDALTMLHMAILFRLRGSFRSGENWASKPDPQQSTPRIRACTHRRSDVLASRQSSPRLSSVKKAKELKTLKWEQCIVGDWPHVLSVALATLVEKIDLWRSVM